MIYHLFPQVNSIRFKIKDMKNKHILLYIIFFPHSMTNVRTLFYVILICQGIWANVWL